jgi:tRNA1(Val) A37 N6-methylase TrmN6
MAQNTTLDGLLDRRVAIEQPKDGWRIAIDTVLLAASVPITAGERALDLGCGVGGAMLCLATRVTGISATGIESDDELAQICETNIARNGFGERLNVLHGDVTQLPENLFGLFDHTLMNPPYHDEARHDVSEDARKRAANAEKDGDLARWIISAARALKPSGLLTMIHRADRAPQILDLLRTDFGVIEILPLLPKEGAVAKRVILRARKISLEGAQNTTECYRKNFVLHQADGAYTEAAEAILRHMKALDFAAE